MKRGLIFFCGILRAWKPVCADDDALAEYVPHASNRQRLHNLRRHVVNHGRVIGSYNVLEA